MGATIPHYWTTAEIAKRLRVDESTVRRWCQAGRLTAYQVGRVWLVPDETAEQFIAEQLARWH